MKSAPMGIQLQVYYLDTRSASTIVYSPQGKGLQSNYKENIATNMDAQDFPAWLEQKYLSWQEARGKRATLGQFAAYLGISPPLLSHYLNGLRKPSGDNVHKLAKQLGPEAYDILGLQIPDPKLRFISRNWVKLSVEQQQQLISTMEKLLKAGHEKTGGEANPRTANE